MTEVVLVPETEAVAVPVGGFATSAAATAGGSGSASIGAGLTTALAGSLAF